MSIFGRSSGERLDRCRPRYLALTRYLQVTVSMRLEPFMTALVLVICISWSGGSVQVLDQADCRGCFNSDESWYLKSWLNRWAPSLAITLSHTFASHVHGTDTTWMDTCFQISLMPISNHRIISLTLRHVFATYNRVYNRDLLIHSCIFVSVMIGSPLSKGN